MTLDEFMFYVDDNNVSVGAYIYDENGLRRVTYFDYLCIDLHVRDK